MFYTVQINDLKGLPVIYIKIDR